MSGGLSQSKDAIIQAFHDAIPTHWYETLTRVCIQTPAFDVLEWFRWQSDSIKHVWSSRSDSVLYLGLGSAYSISGHVSKIDLAQRIRSDRRSESECFLYLTFNSNVNPEWVSYGSLVCGRGPT